jgi:hypothetical protein
MKSRRSLRSLRRAGHPCGALQESAPQSCELLRELSSEFAFPDFVCRRHDALELLKKRANESGVHAKPLQIGRALYAAYIKK